MRAVTGLANRYVALFSPMSQTCASDLFLQGTDQRFVLFHLRR
jgi:hypothetical protein